MSPCIPPVTQSYSSPPQSHRIWVPAFAGMSGEGGGGQQ